MFELRGPHDAIRITQSTIDTSRDRALKDALFEDDVGVEGLFARCDDGVGLFGPLVEGETLDELKIGNR